MGAMPITSADDLLAALDPLPYPERTRTAARTARALAAAGELPALLRDLERHGLHGRRIAALAAAAGRETGYLAERLTDPDRVVRGYAIAAVRTLPVPDEAVEAALLDAPAAVRSRLARAVVLGRRTELAERLLPRLRERWGDA